MKCMAPTQNKMACSIQPGTVLSFTPYLHSFLILLDTTHFLTRKYLEYLESKPEKISLQLHCKYAVNEGQRKS